MLTELIFVAPVIIDVSKVFDVRVENEPEDDWTFVELTLVKFPVIALS